MKQSERRTGHVFLAGRAKARSHDAFAQRSFSPLPRSPERSTKVGGFQSGTQVPCPHAVVLFRGMCDELLSHRGESPRGVRIAHTAMRGLRPLAKNAGRIGILDQRVPPRAHAATRQELARAANPACQNWPVRAARIPVSTSPEPPFRQPGITRRVDKNLGRREMRESCESLSGAHTRFQRFADSVAIRTRSF